MESRRVCYSVRVRLPPRRAQLACDLIAWPPEATERGRSMDAQWNDGRRFEGRVAVVTGGGGTLGGAVARAFGLEGASVALGYRSSRSQAGEVVAELEVRGGQAHSA